MAVIVAFSGGVGGGKFASGLARCVPPDELMVVVNTADDFDLWGLHIMPDLDSVLYAMSGLGDTKRGWGRANESWNCRAALTCLGADPWFSLGDRDLATHLIRSGLLHEGWTYSAVAGELASRMGIESRILPMTDDPVVTRIVTPDGEIGFQDYFVRERCAPHVTALRYEGAETASAGRWLDTLRDGTCTGLIICPSNPYLSIDPILALPGVREALRERRFPCVAVSPIVDGKAVKGPLAKLLAGFGRPVSWTAIAEHYGDFLDGILIDKQDATGLEAWRGLQVKSCDTLMVDPAAKTRVALAALKLLQRCAVRRSPARASSAEFGNVTALQSSGKPVPTLDLESANNKSPP